LILLFVVVPLSELYLLLWVGSRIGFWPTVGITLVTAVVGGSLARREGLKVWRAWRHALANLEPPAQGIIEGMLVLVGGTLLITPGLMTDAVGLLLLFPATRRRVAQRVRRAVEGRIASGQIRVVDWRQQGRAPDAWISRAPRHDRVIDTTGETRKERD
jgi:UPF0716 protein FxsA